MYNCVSFLKKYGRPLSICLVTLVIAAVLYYLNRMTPLYADDYCYSLSFATLERIESVGQIPASQINHYYTTNGRILLHTLAQLFLLAGKNCFNLINTAAFLLLLYLIYFHIYGSFKAFSAARLAVIAGLLLVSTPAFGQSFLWVTGASNYLYGILLVLLALAPFRKQAAGSRTSSVSREILLALLGLIPGFLAGATNENTSVAMIAMMLGYLLLFRCRRIPIHGWNVTMPIAAVAGCLFMLTAPGNSVRMATAGGSGGLMQWIRRGLGYTYDLFTNLHLLVLLFTLLLCLYIAQNRHRIAGLRWNALAPLAEESALTLVYFLGFLGSVYSMVAAPGFAPRVWSGPTVLAIILVGNLSTLTDLNTGAAKIFRTGFAVFLLVFSVCTLEVGQYELENVQIQYNDRQQQLSAAMAEGQTRVELPTIRTNGNAISCYTIYGDIQADNTYWLNEAMALYYGLDKIILTH